MVNNPQRDDKELSGNSPVFNPPEAASLDDNLTGVGNQF